jgi:hypothetical protein
MLLVARMLLAGQRRKNHFFNTGIDEVILSSSKDQIPLPT